MNPYRDRADQAAPMKICQLPAKTGPNFGKPAEGTKAGLWRHKRANEPPCDECIEGNRLDRHEYHLANRVRENQNSLRYYQENREQVLANSRAWAVKNRDRTREATRRWRNRNPVLARAAQREHYWNNRETERERGRAYRQANPHIGRASAQRRRARERAVLILDFSHDQLVARLSMFAGCWMCGGEADTVDHVKPIAAGGAHILANLRPACLSCNTSKGSEWPL